MSNLNDVDDRQQDHQQDRALRYDGKSDAFPSLPHVEFDGAAPLAQEAGRRSLFNALVTEDSDVVGLVAYSLYKQNKHDFLVAFSREWGRGPDERELAAYTLGEATARRLATYRHLAQETLAGRGPDSPQIQMSKGKPARASGGAAGGVSTQVNALTLVAVAAVFVWLVSRFGFSG